MLAKSVERRDAPHCPRLIGKARPPTSKSCDDRSLEVSAGRAAGDGERARRGMSADSGHPVSPGACSPGGEDVLQPAGDGQRWAALLALPNREGRVARHCTCLGVRHYLPVRSRHPVFSGIPASTEPLFPGYVFACLDGEVRGDLLPPGPLPGSCQYPPSACSWRSSGTCGSLWIQAPIAAASGCAYFAGRSPVFRGSWSISGAGAGAGNGWCSTYPSSAALLPWRSTSTM